MYQVEGQIDRIPELTPDQTPNRDVQIATSDVPAELLGELPAPIVSHLEGWIVVAEEGEVQFRLTSDDGSRLRIDGTTLIEHDGPHGATSKDGEFVPLAAGPHALFLEHFDSGGERSIQLEWRRSEDSEFTLLSGDDLRCERDLTRVTSPGVKSIRQAGRPGDLQPLQGVHPSYRLETIRPEGFEPKIGAMAFLPDGRLAFGTFDPLQRDERVLPDIDSKEPDKIYALDVNTSEMKVLATDVYEPTGMCVAEGELYVAHRKAITRLTDADGDDFYETHEVVGSGWEGWNYHQFVFGLVHRSGKLYAGLSTTMAPPGWEGMKTNAGPNGPMRGGFLEVDLSSGDTRVIAGGARTPNGLGKSFYGLLYTDNQGAWMPASVLCEVWPGRFYGHYNWTNPVTKLLDRFPHGGHPSVYCDRPRTPPALWLPQNEVVNSPTEILTIPNGQPFAQQLLIGELTAGGIRRVALQHVNGVLQGALFRHTQGFEVGIHRMRFGPDGSLYVGGIGAGGNWNWRGTQFGLQRLTPTGETAFEMEWVRAKPDGFEVQFTEDVDLAWAGDASSYALKSWTYAATENYGGSKIDEREHLVEVVRFGAKSAHLSVDGLETGRVYHLRLIDPVSVSGKDAWSTECWYTLQQIPRVGTTRNPSIGVKWGLSVGVGILPPPKAVTLLPSAFPMSMSHKPNNGQAQLQSQSALLESDPYKEVGEGSGDLSSTTEFADARIHVEWYCPPGGEGQRAGNSGVYLQDRYEVQVLGSAPAPHEPALDEAGAIYNAKLPDVNASTGPGTWQAYDLWFTSPRFARGMKVANARLTAYWNGILVHDDVEIEGPTGGGGPESPAAAPNLGVQIGRLRLQDHESDAEGAVRYRNVWIAPYAPPPTSSSSYGPWLDLLEEGEWSPRGGAATYSYEDGVLSGTTAPDTPNTFWTSSDTYDDFELLYEAKVHPELNSGVQIRSHVDGGIENRDGGLIGYQIELDPSERNYSGGIYDERRRGWLYPLHSAPYARRAFKPGEWNKFRVVARENVIRTWINGIPAAEIFDVLDRNGHFGFQVHGVGPRKDPLTVQWRNVRLRRFK